jgi:hypothetical protein
MRIGRLKRSRHFLSGWPTIFYRVAVLAIVDKQDKRKEKAALCEELLKWLLEDEKRGKVALSASAQPVIAMMQAIEKKMSRPAFASTEG